MLEKFLQDIVSIIIGKQSEGVADLLHSSNYVNEFLIAKKLGITINQARNILYKLADNGVVSSIRKKDKKKGWYTYFWKFEVIKALEFLQNVILKKAEQLSGQIKSRETKQFYVCPLCHVEFTEENALLHDFTCPECGNILVIKDNASVLKELGKSLDKLHKELKIVNEEISKERENLDKKRIKENLASKKKAAKARGKKSLKKIIKKSSKKEIKKDKKRERKKIKLKLKKNINKKIKKRKKSR